MRLGQLARKYDISIQKIIAYLDEIERTYDSHHPNSKLDEQTEALIEKHFEHLLNKSQEDIEKPNEELHEVIEVLNEEMPEEIEQNSVELEVVDIVATEEVPLSELEVPLVEAKVQVSQKKEEVVIESDRLLELLESDEMPIDLSKITLIKAPKKALSGLKVVGKIELAEPKIKTSEISDEQKKEYKSKKNGKDQAQQLREEDQEKKRLRFKKNKEEYEERQKKQRREKENKARKVINEAHYKKKLEQAKSKQSKPKARKQLLGSTSKEESPKPKTILGRFLRWLNT